MREEGRRQDCKIMHENKPSGEEEGRLVKYATLGYGRSEMIGERDTTQGDISLRDVKKMGMEDGQRSKL